MIRARQQQRRRIAAARPGEQGAAMLVVTTILVALLAGGGVALYVQLQSTRTAGLAKGARTSLYCAEAGLNAARSQMTNQQSLWPDLIDSDTSNDPSWYPLTGDYDGDGVNDYEVRLVDNDDEVPSNTNLDSDGRHFLVSTCIQDNDFPRTVSELIEASNSGYNYRNVSGGGPGNTGNQN